MSILIIGWGTVTTCISAVQNYPGLVMARFALGIPEAGFFPDKSSIFSHPHTADHSTCHPPLLVLVPSIYATDPNRSILHF